jgi:hypothetical protein
MADEELIKRLERLERENRRMRRLGGAALILAAALGAIYATRPVPDVVTSHKFVLLDREGHARITISTPAYAGAVVDETHPDDPAVWISDARGQDRAILTSDGLRFADEKVKPLADYLATPGVIKAHEFDVVDGAGATKIQLFASPQGEPTVRLHGTQGQILLDTGGGPGITLLNAHGGVVTLLGGGKIGGFEGGPEISFFGPSGAAIDLSVEKGEPKVSLSDGHGFSMDLGSTGVVAPTTGASENTSAASIVMFGNDKKHHVIWRAP